jgi:hypothetical protein
MFHLCVDATSKTDMVGVERAAMTDLLLWRAMVVAAQTRSAPYPPVRWQAKIHLLSAALRRIMAISRKRETRT